MERKEGERMKEYELSKEYDLDDLGIVTNSINYIILKNGRQYDVHDLILTSMKKDNEPRYFDLKGQYTSAYGNEISERIVGRIEEIDIIGVEYS